VVKQFPRFLLCSENSLIFKMYEYERFLLKKKKAEEEDPLAKARRIAHAKKLEERRERRAQGIVIPSQQAAPSNIPVDVESVQLRGYHTLRRVFPAAPHKELMGALQQADHLPINTRVVVASRQLMTNQRAAADSTEGSGPATRVYQVVPSGGAAAQLKLLRRVVTVGPTIGTRTSSVGAAAVEASPSPPKKLSETIEEDDLMTTLMKLLTSQGLADKTNLAKAWVDEQGACDLEEVADNFADFAEALGFDVSSSEDGMKQKEQNEDSQSPAATTATTSASPGTEATETQAEPPTTTATATSQATATAPAAVLSPIEQLRSEMLMLVANMKAKALEARDRKIEMNKGKLDRDETQTGQQQQQQQQQRQHQEATENPQQKPLFQPPMRLVRLVKTVSTPVQPLGARLLSSGVAGAPTKVVVVKTGNNLQQQQQQQQQQGSEEEKTSAVLGGSTAVGEGGGGRVGGEMQADGTGETGRDHTYKPVTGQKMTHKIERANSLDLAELPPGVAKHAEGARVQLATQERLAGRHTVFLWDAKPHRVHVNDQLLRARIPTEAELKAKEIAQKAAIEANEAYARQRFGPEFSGSKGDEDESGKSLRNLAGVRQAFMQEHGTAIKEELGSHVRIRPVQLSSSVEDRFVKTVQMSGAVPSAGYHGTAKHNFDKIFRQGLVVPVKGSGVKVVNGSAHGVGIYTAKQGAASLSRSFCDSEDMLICGVVTKQVEKGKDDAEAKRPKMVNYHRDHHKPERLFKGNPKKMGFHTVYRDDTIIREVGSARVIFKEEFVAPLFVAEGAGRRLPVPAVLDPNKTIPENPNKTGHETRGGKQQELIQENGERIWMPPTAERDWNARRVKRMLKDKELAQSRSNDRAVKAALLNDDLIED